MNAAQFRAWARPRLKRTAEVSFFLSLPGAWERAAGAGHFLESSASSAAPGELKLALILAAPASGFGSCRSRDRAAKAAAAQALVRGLNGRFGGRYDSAKLSALLLLLARWRLRGSLMLSLDFDAASGTFGKLSCYAYLPGGPGLAALARELGIARPAAPLAAGADLEFAGLDLFPDGRAALKLYHRAAYRPALVPPPLRRPAAALAELGVVRDVTRLTRLYAGARAESGGKLYLGLARGLALADLARCPGLGPHAGFLRELAAGGPGQRAWFVGFQDGQIEVYFDRRRLG